MNCTYDGFFPTHQTATRCSHLINSLRESRKIKSVDGYIYHVRGAGYKIWIAIKKKNGEFEVSNTSKNLIQGVQEAVNMAKEAMDCGEKTVGFLRVSI